MLGEVIQLILYACVFLGGYYLGSHKASRPRYDREEESLEHVENDWPEAEDVEEKRKRRYIRYGFFN